MDLKLENLIDGKRIVAIDALPIPAPPHATQPGEHLFVNCHYDISMSKWPLPALLDAARRDALEILRRLSAISAVRQCVGVVVRVQGHFPLSEIERPARRRIYEVAILTKDLPASSTPLTLESLPRLGAVESSQLGDIAELMHQPAH